MICVDHCVECRHTLLQYLLSLQHMFNNEHTTSFSLLAPEISPKQVSLETKKKSSSFCRLFILKLLLFSFHKQKDFALSCTSSTCFSTNANVIKAIHTQQRKFGNQAVNVPSSTLTSQLRVQHKTAEANAKLSAIYTYCMHQSGKQPPQTLYPLLD